MLLSTQCQFQMLQTLLLLFPLQGLLRSPRWLPHFMLLHLFMVRSWQALCKVEHVKIIVQYTVQNIIKPKFSVGVLLADSVWGWREGWECSAGHELLTQEHGGGCLLILQRCLVLMLILLLLLLLLLRALPPSLLGAFFKIGMRGWV
jgi:hypothetical protein